MNSNYLLDKDFLKKLDYSQNKENFVRIIALDNDDIPVQEIIGRATSGSVNIDGASAIRRSCSLSLVAKKEDTILTDQYWSFNHKFKLEIGQSNYIDNKYPDVLWFNMGTYVITNFSYNQSTSTLSISISGKDKMCRLNGEIGGNIPMSTDFGTIEESEIVELKDDNGNQRVSQQITITKLPIKDIIINAMEEYGKELKSNIIINNLEDYGYDLWEYRGENPLYLILNESNQVFNLSFDGNIQLPYNGKNIKIKDLEIEGGKYYSFNTLDKTTNIGASEFIINEKPYKVARVKLGETAGYHRVPLVYNSDLILNAGDTVTSLLDKLVKMLGEYEYFYDLNGHFVFQKKKNYIQEIFFPNKENEAAPTSYNAKYSYYFEDEKLFTSISHNPNINNIKNDFSIWGVRASITNTNLPIHIRYAIDKKPTSYISPYEHYEKQYIFYIFAEEVAINSTEEFEKYAKGVLYEYIENGDIKKYKIATEYISSNKYYKILERTTKDSENKYSSYQKDLDNSYIPFDLNEQTEEYYLRIKNNEGQISYKPIEATDEVVFPIYSHISAGAEYKVSEYDWREILYQMAKDHRAHNQDADYYVQLRNYNAQYDWGRTGYEQYYSDILGFWRELYNPSPTPDDVWQYGDYYGNVGNYNINYWNKKLHSDPNSFDFWFDFLDTEGELKEYAVKEIDTTTGKYKEKIGVRSKVVNDNSVKSIYYNETPETLFVISPKENISNLQTDEMAFVPIQIQENMESLFFRSSQGISALEKANELIYKHTIVNESISINSIPIYYLQPNTRIYVKGHGDYLISKISMPLSYNGTMSISGTKVFKQIY